MPAPGDRPGRLQLLGEIARGGMGAVLKGRDPDIGRDLAVKVLLESHRDKPELIRRFIEEAQIGGQLQHPGIVPIYELGAFADRRPYFAMKLVKGRTLSSLLDERPDPARDLPRFLSIFEAVCQTMAYAHARGVIHRDLKPSNIMVGSFGEVQVMDWGLAKVLPQGGAADDASAGKTRDRETVIATARSGSDTDSDLSRAGSVMGTPSYMAPEQARGETDRLDERCDVFALGSILCEILTGDPAFTGRSSGEIQRKASRGELKESIDRLDHCGADPELIALAKDCLAPELEDRPRHAGEVAERITAHRAGVEERLRRRRSPAPRKKHGRGSHQARPGRTRPPAADRCAGGVGTWSDLWVWAAGPTSLGYRLSGGWRPSESSPRHSTRRAPPRPSESRPRRRPFEMDRGHRRGEKVALAAGCRGPRPGTPRPCGPLDDYPASRARRLSSYSCRSRPRPQFHRTPERNQVEAVRTRRIGKD